MWDTSSLYSQTIKSQLTGPSAFKLFDIAKSNRHLVQRLNLTKNLEVHKGCVNTICWSDCGRYLLSGSDDQRLCVTDSYTYKVEHDIQTGHRANIFSAKFLPNTGNRHIVSCSGDGAIIFSDTEKPETSVCNIFNCHYGTAYEVATVPNDSNTFLSCGEDGTVRWFDLRTKQRCSESDCKEDILINCRYAVTALAVNHLVPYMLAIGCADSNVRIFDRRTLGTRALGNYGGTTSMGSVVTRFTVPDFDNKHHRITSLCYSPDAREMLVSYSSDHIYLFDTLDSHPAAKVLSTGPAKRSSSRKSIRRLRVRGDWSDTGPDARPETERAGLEVASDGEDRPSSRPNLMQRMSEVLTRIFNSPTGHEQRPGSASRADASSPSPVVMELPVPVPTTSSGTSGATTTRLTPILKKVPDCDTVRNVQTKHVQVVEEPPREMYSPTTSSASMESDIPSDSCAEDDASRYSSDSSSDVPGNKTFSNSLHNLERELINRREQLMSRSSREPVVNLQYSGQGVNNGLITVESSSVGLSPGSPSMSSSGFLSAERPSSVMSDSLLVPGSVSPVPGFLSRMSGSEMDASESMVVEVEVPQRTWHSDDHLGGPVLEDDDDGVTEQADGRRSRRGRREDDDEDEDVTPAESPVDSRPKPQRNPREMLLRSFDDVLKHFREEREQEQAQLASLGVPRIKQRFTGHRNARTMIKEATFWGNDYIMSGSDCGHIFIWDRYTAELVMLLQADNHVVNCLQPHPFDPILASSGIDYDIKLWTPCRSESEFDERKAAQLVRRNEMMLEETKDTITVPASFMIRMLTSLNQLRANRPPSRATDNESDAEILSSQVMADYSTASEYHGVQSGLVQSEGHKVVSALLKVQDKLRKLESRNSEADSSQGSSHSDQLDHESVDSHIEAKPRNPIAEHRVSRRLDLIEQKLDLVTQLLLLNVSNVQVPQMSSRKVNRPIVVRMRTSDRQVELKRSQKQVQDLFYDMRAEFQILKEEAEVLHKKLSVSNNEADSLSKQLVLMAAKLDKKKQQMHELASLNEQLEMSSSTADSGYCDLWPNRTAFRKERKPKALTDIPKWK
ncbi:DDB1- and CUL4-associated factor 6 [Halotydeus destructor]|nr:DDB1- and CUL4-associated factor 6 [Halotydeus destructor]